jgi:hypothetical protein
MHVIEPLLSLKIDTRLLEVNQVQYREIETLLGGCTRDGEHNGFHDHSPDYAKFLKNS